MNNPINYSPDQPDETMLKARNAIRAAWILVAAAALTVLFYLYLAYLTSAWQLLGAAGAATIILVSGILGVMLNRQGRVVLGAQVVIFGIGLAFLAFSIFIAGLGLIFVGYFPASAQLVKAIELWYDCAALIRMP